MTPAVAEIASKATADAFCVWAVAQAIAPFHRDGTINVITDAIVARVGSDTFQAAHRICDAALLNNQHVGAWRE